MTWRVGSVLIGGVKCVCPSPTKILSDRLARWVSNTGSRIHGGEHFKQNQNLISFDSSLSRSQSLISHKDFLFDQEKVSLESRNWYFVYRFEHALIPATSFVRHWSYACCSFVCFPDQSSAPLRGWLVALMRPSKGPPGTFRCNRPMFGCPGRTIYLHPLVPLASIPAEAVSPRRASLASRDGLVLGGKRRALRGRLRGPGDKSTRGDGR
jgi:hypothetical protein